MLRHARVFSFLFLVAAAGCTDQAPIPDADRLPPADQSLDPNRLQIGTILYACGHWSGLGRPDSPSVLVDVQFNVRSAADPLDRPRNEALQAAEAVGLRPLFVFQFPMVRGRIATNRIPALDSTGVVLDVLTVPDPRRYDVSVDVGFSHPLTTRDSLDFVALGGRVRDMWAVISALAGDLPNASAIALRSKDVKWLEVDGIICAQGGGVIIPPPVRATR